MYKTYFKLAVRSLIKNKIFSLINVFGLAIGFTCCLLISMYLMKEFSYDAHQKLGNRLYQLQTYSTVEGKEDISSTTPAPMAPAMQMEFPEIENTTRIIDAFQDDKTLIQYKQGNDLKSFYETRGFFADSTFFRLFTYDFKEGDPLRALDQPNSVVLSQEVANKIFGNTPALNKIIHIISNTNGEYDFVVSGVFKPSHTPSHIDARFIMSMKGGDVGRWMNSISDMVNNNMFYSYLLLKPGANAKTLEAKFPSFIQHHAGTELKLTGRSRRQFLVPVRDVHLHGAEANVSPRGNLGYLYILISIAFVTILIASVNFMNLSTARSSKRALEIGVRKVLGAEKKSLVRQFLLEAILLSLFAMLLALAFSSLLRPIFEQVSGKQLSFSRTEYFALFLGLLTITFLTGLIAGVYPAFYLSAFKPVKVLKGKFVNSLAAISFRKALVVFQFVISVALIVASLTIGNQMQFLRKTDLGFDKEQQIVIPLRTTTAKNIFPALKNEILSKSSITSAGGSIFYPGINNTTDWLLYRQGQAASQTRDIFLNWVDETFLQTLKMRLAAGRLFSKDFPADTADRIIINEQAVKAFGFSSAEDALGKNIVSNFNGYERLFSIIGVVRDFHFKGLHSKIESYGFFLDNHPEYNYLIAHAEKGNIHAVLDNISAAWSRLNPNEPFEYSFLDQDFQKNYASEERLAAIIRYFTIVAVFISCLGLFGLTTFSVEQRTKEIGIRKVLGSSTAGIVSLLSADFLKLVLLSFLIASPLAWYFIHKWLEDFAYKAPFTIWIVLSGWAIALCIAFITISIQALKVALANPIRNLRTE
jgi:putative ABC transport system permease protein